MSPLVSVIIPCRNERRHMKSCLGSLTTQDFSKSEIEILIVDGMSEDGTTEIVKHFIQGRPFMKLIDNPKKIIPAAMNLGIKNAKGKIIVKTDAHTVYPKDYISKCVEALGKYDADNVGGILVTMPGDHTLQAKAIAISLSHPFGVGSSPFRQESFSKKPRWVDTVAFGCYKREVFEKVGLYNENLVRSSDMEFNIRLKKAGGKILLLPDIMASYYADSTFETFWQHNVKDGIWAIYPLKFTKVLFRPRHFVPFLFISSFLMLLPLSFLFRPLLFLLLLILGGYMFGAFISSLQIVFQQRDIRYLYMMPIAFIIRHFAYGLGSLWGFLKLWI